MKETLNQFTPLLEPIIAIMSILITLMVLLVGRIRRGKIYDFFSRKPNSSIIPKVSETEKLIFDPITGEFVVASAELADALQKEINTTDSITKDGFAGGSDTQIKTEHIEKSFENLHLSNYYKETLYQSRISFWFSLVFASLGFSLIVLSVVLHSSGSFEKTILTGVSGVIIDAVSILFFTQSNKAQKAVGVFFEKLRRDKQIHDSKKIAESITDIKLRDKIKAELSIKLLGSD